MKASLRSCLGLLALGVVLAFAGCGGDDDDSSNAGGTSSQGGGGNAAGSPSSAGGAGSVFDSAVECEVLGELCHEADPGSGPIHDCHESGHEGDGAVCSAELSDCIGLCVTDAGDSGQDPHCAALGELCHPVDDGNGRLHDCHELGHEGDPDKCAANFNDCATRCLTARAAAEGGEGGAGAGGAAGSTGGAMTSMGGAMTSMGGAMMGGAATGGAH